MSRAGERSENVAALEQLEELLAALRRSEDARLQDFAISVKAQSRALLIALESSDPPQRMLEWP